VRCLPGLSSAGDHKLPGKWNDQYNDQHTTEKNMMRKSQQGKAMRVALTHATTARASVSCATRCWCRGPRGAEGPVNVPALGGAGAYRAVASQQKQALI